MNKVYRETKKCAADGKIYDYPITEVKIDHEEKTMELLLRKDADYTSEVGSLEFILRNYALEGEKPVELTPVREEGKVLLKYEDIYELLSTMTAHSLISTDTQKIIERDVKNNFFDYCRLL